jgi:hypothetical protein
MKTITINKIKYVSCDDVINKAPIYSKGSRNTREFLKNKSIDDNMYIFAKQNEENNKWIKTNGKSIKFDKVFLNEEILDNIPELNNKDDDIVDDKGIGKAPDIIILDDDNKFKDDKGNIVEIETRGTLSCDNIYFSVKDVIKGFGIMKLDEILIKKNTNYEHNKDYKYFICERYSDGIKKCKKEIFLTYKGFRRMIEVSRNRFSSATINTVHKWLTQQFDTINVDQFQIDIEHDKINSKIGYVYCITSPLVNSVKIGSWKSSIHSLRSRYIIYYGNNLTMFYVKTQNALELERKCQKHFIDNNIENELFDSSYWDAYVDYLKNNTEEIVEKDIIVDDIFFDNTDEIIEKDIDIDDTLDCKQNDETYFFRDIHEDDIISYNEFDNIRFVTGNKCKKTYARVSDIENIFKINIYDYKEYIGKEQKYIDVDNADKKELFLTYEGLLRVMFVSRSSKTQAFTKWMVEKLFTIQLGTTEQKQELASDMIGISAKSLRQVLSTSTTDVPCIYVFSLGKCKTLRKIMKISKDVPDNYTIIKYGYTDDLAELTKEYIEKYESISEIKLELMNYTYIDPKYLSNAEKDIKEFFENSEIPIEYEQFIDLVAIDPLHVKHTSLQFKYMVVEYAGCVKNFIKKIENLNEKNENLKKDVKKDDKNYELNTKNLKKIHELEKENLNAKHDNLKKDLKNYELAAENLKKFYELELKNKDSIIENRDLKLNMYQSKNNLKFP